MFPIYLLKLNKINDLSTLGASHAFDILYMLGKYELKVEM